MKPAIAIKLFLPCPSLRPHLDSTVRDQPRLNMLPRAATFTAGRGAEKIVKSVSKVFKRSKSVSATHGARTSATVGVQVDLSVTVTDVTGQPPLSKEIISTNEASAFSAASERTSSSQSSTSVQDHEPESKTSTIPFPTKSQLSVERQTLVRTARSRPILRRMPAMSFSALGLRRTIQRKLSAATHISSLMPSASFITARTSMSRSASSASIRDDQKNEAGDLPDADKFPSHITDLSALMETYLSFTPSDSWQSDAFWQLPPVSSTVLLSLSPVAPPSSPVPHAALVQDNMFLRPGPRAMHPQTVPGGSPFFGSMSAKSVRSRKSLSPGRRRVSRGGNMHRRVTPTVTPPRGSYLGTCNVEGRDALPTMTSV
ncbi:unnamed protein product [Peniophora sp. CBMAI 1063]|nr:unnamed protein product [Peniophora sp. CBMAI 1063]